MAKTPDTMLPALEGMMATLDETNTAPPPLPSQIEVDATTAELAYPMKQMLNACALIRRELESLD
jgi:hypothetical protein